jgi:FkbM family methyltransferase
VWKAKLVKIFSRLLLYIYIKPLEGIGTIIGKLLSKMPILLSSSLKQAIEITTSMPLSLDIKIVVDRVTDYKRAQFCNKERLTCQWIEKYYKKGDVIYDIGANVGAVSLVSAIHLEKDCLIYAFEPLPTTFSMLFKNVMKNDCDKVIVPLNIALSNDIKINKFNITSIESGTSGHSIDKKGVIRKFNKSLTVFTNTLDNIVDSYGIKLANHIKIDVDGLDYEVLLGGEDTVLNSSELRTILIEKNGKENQVRDLVKKYGFIEVELTGNKGKYENIGFIRDRD